MSLYTSLTADLIENPKLLRSGCGHDEKVVLEIKQKLDDLEELIQEGLDKFYYDSIHSKSFFNFDHGPSVETSWSRDQAHFVCTGPWKEDVCFFIDLKTLEAFKVDSEVDNLTDEEIYEKLGSR